MSAIYGDDDVDWSDVDGFYADDQVEVDDPDAEPDIEPDDYIDPRDYDERALAAYERWCYGE